MYPQRQFIGRQMRKVSCPECKGSGQVLHNEIFDYGFKPCVACKGTGQIEVPVLPEIRQRQNTSLRI